MEKDLRSSLTRRHARTAKRNKTAEDFIYLPWMAVQFI
jgi:hypothetical protein